MGQSANAFTIGVLPKKQATAPSGNIQIDIPLVQIFGATSAGTVVITLTAKGDKYSGSLTLADFAIAKQTATDTLSMADLVISYVSGDGNKVVSTAEILGQLSVSSTGTAQTQKSEWTLVSVADTDNNGDLAVTGSGKTLTISDEIKTKTTVTATLAHPAYENKTATFELSTESSKISTTAPSGSGKWGKSYTTNYNLRRTVGSVTFTNADYTFSIVPTGDDGSGKTPTTSGIVASGQNAISNPRTGAIDASKLTKSGTLLIKIVRAAKGAGAARVDAVTEYQNFTVSKQQASDHTGFAVSAGAITWNANSQTVSYTEANKPAGIGNATYALTTTGTTAGPTSGGNAITVASSDGKIANTSKGGVVKVQVTYAANDKYETITRNVDVTIDKQTGIGRLSVGDLVIPFGASDTSKTVNTATITGKLTVPNSLGAKSEWTLTGLRNSDGNSNITIGTGGNSLTITGAIPTSTTVTARFESDKYVSRVVDFGLSTGAGVMTAPSDTRTGLTGKWGVGFTSSANDNVDYKLKGSDAVGDTTVSFTTGSVSTASDYTFTIVTGNVPSDAPSGTKATTTGILDTSKTAINAKNGAINGTALTKSGDLLVKIVRKAKGGLPALTDYQNITVTKQQGTDHPNFAVTAGAIAWNANSQAVSYTEANKPTGIGTATYTLTASGTTAGSTTGDNAITVASSDGKIGKTTQSGAVKVRITYAANDKYETITEDVDVTVNKQTVGAGTLSVANLVVTFVSGTKKVTAADVLGQLSISSGSVKSDWTVKSLADTDDHTNVAVTDSGKSLTLSGAGITSGTTTITVVFESTKYNDITKTFELSTRSAQVIDGTPSGLSGKWDKGTVTPNYKLKARDQGQTFVKATDYTFSVVPSSDGGQGDKDATTAGIVVSGSDGNPDYAAVISNARTGVVDTSNLTKSGKLLIKIVRAAKGSGASAVAAATEYVNFDVTKQVLGTDVTTAPAVATATGENGKWKAKIDLDYTLPGLTDESDYLWAVDKKLGAEPDGTLTIDSSGDISGAASSGTAEITITAKASNPKYSGSIRTADFTIAKQVLGTDVTTPPAVATATGEDGKWKSSTSAKIALNYSLPGATTAAQYSWAVGKKSGAEPSGTLVIDQSNGHISGATSSGTAEITITAKAANKKYSGSIRTADFAIGKQTATGKLSVASLVVPYVSGDKVVSASDIERQLSVTGGTSTQSDWKVKSLTKKDANSNFTIANDGKSLTIKGAFTTSTTVTVVFESTKYADKTVDFELSTRQSQMFTGVVTGLSGKWGKGKVTPDYKLKTSDGGERFVKGVDFTFSVVAAGTTVSGYTSTTAGIGTGSVIGALTGEIDTSKLTKSGTLLIRIFRSSKGSVDAVTEHVNFTVQKQVFGTGSDADEKTVPTISLANGEDRKWKSSTGTKFDMAYTNLPFSLSADDFAWEVNGKSGSAPSGTLAIDKDGKVSGAESAGTAVITVKAKTSDDKYEGEFTLADFAITRQTTTDTLSAANIVIPYGTGISSTVSVNTAAILDKLTVTKKSADANAQTQKSDWQIKSLTESSTNLDVVNNNSLSIKGAIDTPTAVTVVYEDKNNRYADVTKTFTIATDQGSISSNAGRSGSGKWGAGQTYTATYNLNTSDKVGDVSANFVTTGNNPDYSFSIVDPATGAQGGKPQTTDGIVNGQLTGAINNKTGAIDASKLTKSGKLLIKIDRVAKGGLPAITEYESFDVRKQTIADHTGFRVSATGIAWATASTAVSYDDSTNKPAGIGTATYTLIPSGTTAGTAAGDGHGNIEVASSDGKIAKTVRAGVVKVRVTYAANDKYAQMTRDVNVPINKQTETGNISIANVVAPYASGSNNVTVDADDILGNLSVSQGGNSQKGDWKIKTLTKRDTIADSILEISGKTLIVKGVIAPSKTIEVVLESDKYGDKTVDFKLSTSAGTMSTGDKRTGLSGTWGKTFAATNYQLKTSDTVGGTTATFKDDGTTDDFTFTIESSTTTPQSGYTATTSGIVNGSLQDGIDDKTGAIEGSKLTKSGTLLVKIVRKAKGGLPALTDYQNITVTKQELGAGKDVTTIPTISLAGGDNKWKTNPNTKFNLAYANLPGNQAINTFDWEVKGKSGSAPSGTLIIDQNDGKISGATSAGTVVITVKAKTTDPKYTGQLEADFAITKQTTNDLLRVTDIVVPFLNSAVPVANSTIEGNLNVTGQGGAAKSQKSDWKVKDLRKTHSNLDIRNDILYVTGKISSADGDRPAVVTVTFESDKYNDKIITFNLTTSTLKLFSDTPTGTTGKWGKAFTVDYKLQTSDGGETFTTGASGDFTFEIVNAGSMPSDAPSGLKATTANMFTSSPIHSKTGAITGTNLLRSGYLLVKISRIQRNAVPAITEYLNITVTKQDVAIDITKPTFTSTNPKWGAKIPVTFAGIPSGTTFADYDWTAAPKTSGVPTGTLGVVSDGITGATSAGTVVVTMKAKDGNTKYTGQVDLAEFAITKQTTTDTLSIAEIKFPYSSSSGNQTVSTATIERALAVAKQSGAQNAQTQASAWKLQKLTEKTDHANLAVASGDKTLTVSGAIGTPTTVTAVFEHPAYDDVTFDFTLSTTAGTITDTPSTRTGLSGTWGKAFGATDYKLKASDTVGAVTATFKTDGSNDDFTFSVVPSGTAVTGYTSTTANMFTTSPINSKTGAITGTNLLRGGTLLVKIVRKAKTVSAGTLPEIEDYQNITVNKQNLATDITKPTLGVPQGSNKIWRNNGGNIPVDFNGLPGGTTFGDYTWTAAGNGNKGPDVIGAGLSVTSAGIMGALSGGEVVVTMKAKAGDDKYTGQLNLAAFTIDKQTIMSPISIADIVADEPDSGTTTISEAMIRSQMSVAGKSQKSDWKLKSLSFGGNGNLAVAQGGKSLTVSGAITGNSKVTATFEHKKYSDVSALFSVFTQKGGMYQDGKIPDGSGKWGKSYTQNYYLDTTGGFTTGTGGDYTFSIVPSGTTVTGFKSTTAGIVSGQLAGAINANTGAIDATKLTKGGTLLVKIVRQKSDGSGSLTVHHNFIVGKHVFGTDVKTIPTIGLDTNEDGEWKTSSSAEINLKYTNLPGDGSPQAANTFEWAVAPAGSNPASGALRIDSEGDVRGATSGGKISITVAAKANDPKYTGQFVLADFTIKKQTTPDTLSFGDLSVPQSSAGTDVTFTELLTYLRGAQNKASAWKVTNVTSVVNGIGKGNGNKMVVTGAQSDAVATITLEHPAYENEDVTIKVSTIANPISTGIRSGSGKWGAGQTYTTDYKLKTVVNGVTFNKDKGNSDFEFSIVASQTGFKSTTAGIIKDNNFRAAIDQDTGKIDASKLTQSGTLLVKIHRVGKNRLSPVEEYQNFTVDKRTQADHTDFKVSAPNGFRWSVDSGAVTYPKANTPAGISSPEYFLVSVGTTAGTVTSSGPGSVSVKQSTGRILNTRASGIVKVRVVYPENDKYERMVFNVDVPVKRLPAPVSSFNQLDIGSSGFPDSSGYEIKGYQSSSQTWGSTFTPDITGKMGRFAGVDWYTPVWSITSTTNGGSTAVGGSINQATGVITGTQSSGTITVTVTLPRNVRYEAFNNNSKTFTLTVQRKTQPGRAKSGHGSWSQSNTPRIGAVQRQLSNAIENASGINVARDVKLTKFEDGSDITDGASYGTDYVLTVSFASVNSRPSMVRFLPLEIRDLRIRTISGGAFRKAIKLTFRLPASSNGKYAAKTLVTYWRTK